MFIRCQCRVENLVLKVRVMLLTESEYLVRRVVVDVVVVVGCSTAS